MEKVEDKKRLFKWILLFFLYYVFNILIVNFIAIYEVNELFLVLFNIIFLFVVIFIFWKDIRGRKRIRLKFELKKLLISFIPIYLFLQSFDLFYRDINTFIPSKFNFDFSNISINFTFIALLLCGSVIEELIFRGYMIRRYETNFKTVIGILISSFLFSIAHFGFFFKPFEFFFSKDQFLNYFFLGIILGIIKVRYGLLYAVIAHIIYNFFIYLESQEIIKLFLLDYVNNDYFYILYGITQIILLVVLFLIMNPIFKTKSYW